MYTCRLCFFFFSSRRRHTRLQGDWSSDVCSSDLQTGAAARAMLVQAAAMKWHVDAGELSTGKGRIFHRATGRSVSYGKVASLAATLAPPDLETVLLKGPGQFTIIGRPLVGIDSARIVQGRPIFGVDTRLPGMLYAVYEVAPAHGGRLVKADIEAA